MLKPPFVNKGFVSQTLAHYQETDAVVDWPIEGRLRSVWRSVHVRQTIHAICEWVRWNPVHEQNRLVVEINVTKHSLSCICEKTYASVCTGTV